MQPRPMAETSGPFLPRRRLPIWNIDNSLSAAEPPARLRLVKWDRHPLVTRGCSRNYRQFRTADPERPGEQLDHRVIGGAIGRRLRHPELELLAAVGALTPATDPGPGRA